MLNICKHTTMLMLVGKNTVQLQPPKSIAQALMHLSNLTSIWNMCHQNRVYVLLMNIYRLKLDINIDNILPIFHPTLNTTLQTINTLRSHVACWPPWNSAINTRWATIRHWYRLTICNCLLSPRYNERRWADLSYDMLTRRFRLDHAPSSGTHSPCTPSAPRWGVGVIPT